MTTFVEAIFVVIKRYVIEDKYPAGFENFKKYAPDKTFVPVIIWFRAALLVFYTGVIK